MSKQDEFLTELSDLVDLGRNLRLQSNERIILDLLVSNYEIWYSQSQLVVRVLLPTREADFCDCYRLSRKSTRTSRESTISELFEFFNSVIYWSHPNEYHDKFNLLLGKQLAILEAAQEASPKVLRNIEGTLRGELFDEDLETSKSLLKAKQIRAAGGVAGVVLESHLKTVCKNHSVTLSKKDASIAEYNDALRNSDMYDVPMWRLIQRLGDIRNLCVHKKDREPTADEVSDLIKGVEKVIKEVF